MQNAGIIGTGSYVPEHVITNDDLATIMDTSDEWISTRTGIRSRYYSHGIETWRMGATAAAAALDDAGVAAADVDVIIVTSVTPDYFTPSTACLIQAELGADRAFCFDLNAACTGFVYAYHQACLYLSPPSTMY